MTYLRAMQLLADIGRAWRTEEARATGSGRIALARECRLRAAAVEEAHEHITQEADRQKGKG